MCRGENRSDASDHWNTERDVCRREARCDGARRRREADQAGLLRGRRDAAPATAANFGDDAYRAAGARIVADAADLWSTSDIVFKVRAPEPRTKWRCCARADARQLHLAGAEPRADAGSWPPRRSRCWRWTAVPRIFARAEDGRADLDGQHQRLPRRHRGRQRLRPLLQRPDHRGRQGSAGQGVRRRRRRRRSCGDRHGREPGRHRARQRHARRGRPTRSSRWAASSSRSTTRRKARAAAATPR